jgi:hypothetical protein
MGMARLLAKGWVAFCLFAGAHALNFALTGGTPAADAIRTVGVCTLLFTAMGLLFVGGYAAATDHGGSLLQRMRPQHFLPGFNAMVFVVFACLSLFNQVAYAPHHVWNPASRAIVVAMDFVVPGQRAFDQLPCHLPNSGRAFSFAFAWLLAAIYLASSVSRLRLAAGLIRLERAKRPEALGDNLLALLLGVLAVVGIQLLFVGSAFAFLPCSAYSEISGALLIGLAPLMLSYLIVAALANLLATGHE